jgi:hypothetical protein
VLTLVNFIILGFTFQNFQYFSASEPYPQKDIFSKELITVLLYLIVNLIAERFAVRHDDRNTIENEKKASEAMISAIDEDQLFKYGPNEYVIQYTNQKLKFQDLGQMVNV